MHRRSNAVGFHHSLLAAGSPVSRHRRPSRARRAASTPTVLPPRRTPGGRAADKPAAAPHGCPAAGPRGGPARARAGPARRARRTTASTACRARSRPMPRPSISRSARSRPYILTCADRRASACAVRSSSSAPARCRRPTAAAIWSGPKPLRSSRCSTCAVESSRRASMASPVAYGSGICSVVRQGARVGCQRARAAASAVALRSDSG